CADAFLTPECGRTCCTEFLATAVGAWDLSTPYLFGNHKLLPNPIAGQAVTCTDSHCTYARPRRTDIACTERYATEFGPATFRDVSGGKLGAAVLKGAGEECKEGSQLDWDRVGASVSLSALSFVANDGRTEATQFSTLNRGLYISEQIETLVDGGAQTSALPIRTVAVSVWFTADSLVTSKAGLVSVILDGGGFGTCSKGWQLTYSNKGGAATTLEWKVAVQANDFQNFGGFSKEIVYTVSPGITLGKWYHIVAEYDGSYFRMYLDGAQ
ncbi:hypothetical protein T484DRAFT_1802525, partial [Baffinella frigidus]